MIDGIGILLLLLGVLALAAVLVLWRRSAKNHNSNEAGGTSVPSPPPPSPVYRATDTVQPPNQGDVKVLYVEDNLANATLVRKILDREVGFVLKGAATAAVGLEIARTWVPDVVIMDLHLPGMDGFEALERLKAMPETAAIPVIALTALDSPRDVERGIKAGFAAYVTKPIDITLFLEKLRKVIPPVRP